MKKIKNKTLFFHCPCLQFFCLFVRVFLFFFFVGGAHCLYFFGYGFLSKYAKCANYYATMDDLEERKKHPREKEKTSERQRVRKGQNVFKYTVLGEKIFDFIEMNKGERVRVFEQTNESKALKLE